MVTWTLRFGPSPAGAAWIVERDDGTGQTLACAPEAYEEARSLLLRRAFADDGEAVEGTTGRYPRWIRSSEWCRRA